MLTWTLGPRSPTPRTVAESDVPPKSQFHPTPGIPFPEETEHRGSIAPEICVTEDLADSYTFTVEPPSPRNSGATMSEKQATRAIPGVVKNGAEEES